MGSLAAIYVIWRAWKDRRGLRSPYGRWAKPVTIFAELRFTDRAYPELLTIQEKAKLADSGVRVRPQPPPPGPPDPPVPPEDRVYADPPGRRWWIAETATGRVLDAGVTGG